MNDQNYTPKPSNNKEKNPLFNPGNSTEDRLIDELSRKDSNQEAFWKKYLNIWVNDEEYGTDYVEVIIRNKDGIFQEKLQFKIPKENDAFIAFIIKLKLPDSHHAHVVPGCPDLKKDWSEETKYDDLLTGGDIYAIDYDNWLFWAGLHSVVINLDRDQAEQWYAPWNRL